MPPRKTSTNGKADRNAIAAHAVKEFKYRSIGDIEKKKVHEIARGNLEGEHYRISAEIDVIEEQPLGSEPGAAEQREQYVIRMREQQDILESMINSHNEKIADIDSALVAAQED